MGLRVDTLVLDLWGKDLPLDSVFRRIEEEEKFRRIYLIKWTRHKAFQMDETQNATRN